MSDPTAIDIDYDPRNRYMSGYTAHGNMHFEVPFMSQVTRNLWHGGCSDGLELPEDIKHLVSLYKWETYDLHREMDSVLTVTMYDSVDQLFETIDHLADWVNACRASAPTLVHCQAGLNRSSLVIARALMRGPEGMSGAGAIQFLREKRSPAVLCNPHFERWLLEV